LQPGVHGRYGARMNEAARKLLSPTALYRALRWRARRAVGLPRAAATGQREMVWIPETHVPLSDPGYPTVIVQPVLTEHGRVVPRMVLFGHEQAR
jgi:hypothetical protein